MLSQTTLASESQALSKAGEAVAKELGVDKMLKRLEKKYIPDYIRKHGGFVIAVSKAATEQRVQFKWEF